MRKNLILAAAIAATFTGTAAMATSLTSGSVDYAITQGADFIVGTGQYQDFYAATNSGTATGSGSQFDLTASTYQGGTYSDAGIVAFFDGSVTLGQLQSVTISSNPAGAKPTVNLWLDAGGDGQFFAFAPTGMVGLPGEKLTGLAGDSYLGAGAAGGIDGSTVFNGLGGTAGSYTLSQLQAGALAGVDGSTKVALWVGIAVSGEDQYAYSMINDVKVQLAPAGGPTTVPTPAAASAGLALLGGLGLRRARRS